MIEIAVQRNVGPRRVIDDRNLKRSVRELQSEARADNPATDNDNIDVHRPPRQAPLRTMQCFARIVTFDQTSWRKPNVDVQTVASVTPPSQRRARLATTADRWRIPAPMHR